MIVYNLFPLLAGPFPRWKEHLGRASTMGFNWVFLNPIQLPGASGSLYSIADYFRLNPLLVEGQTHGGLAQALGQAFLENVVFDPESGQLLSGSFMDYAMPRADDLCAFAREDEPVPTATKAWLSICHLCSATTVRNSGS